MVRSFFSRRQIVIAHRGASAYAPENTLASYELALGQGADCVELDLHPTSDGVLVCIHDASLERTTNVRDAFPTRGRTIQEPRVGYHWFVHDFTLAEIKTLDCGSWFHPRFEGSRIQTFEEVLGWATGRTAILAELKHPEMYEPLDVDLLSLFDAEIRRHNLSGSRASDPLVTVQSFHEPTVRRAGALYAGRLPVVFLRQQAEAVQCADDERLAEIATFATGIGPEKMSLEDRPEFVERAHAAGLRVTPWTFNEGCPGGFDSVRAQMNHYLHRLNVDAVITDNPDQAAGLVTRMRAVVLDQLHS
ncbi:MAG TPA: glycerophosphodiester phosphodiesterase family protein [Vicinamibacterales bacterium]|nr:glycerophosphodiester phosphodiesterase family protein [Vicinamibacterales bacterium]